jgi:hypothetical protein
MRASGEEMAVEGEEGEGEVEEPLLLTQRKPIG